MGVGPERLQVICATASFSEAGKATSGKFGAQLAGVDESTFVPITGSLAARAPAAPGRQRDVDELCAIDLPAFYSGDMVGQGAAIRQFLVLP